MSGHMSPAEVNLIASGIAPILKDDATTATAAIDMQGWDGVLFILYLGTTDTTQDMVLYTDSASNFPSATTISGAAITQMSGTADGFISMIDVYRPSERWVRGIVTVGNGSTGGLISVLTMRYRGTGRLPVTQSAFELVKVAQN